MSKSGSMPYGVMQKAAMRASGNTMMHHLQRSGGEIGPLNPHVMPFTKMKSAAMHAAKSGALGKIPGKANVPGDSTRNDKTLILASPGEGIVPRSIMQGLPKAAEGGVVPETKQEPDWLSAAKLALQALGPGGLGVLGTRENVDSFAEGGVVPDRGSDFWGTIKQWMASPNDESKSNSVAEEINKKLPRDLSGRDAVEKKRAQLKKLDEQTKE